MEEYLSGEIPGFQDLILTGINNDNIDRLYEKKHPFYSECFCDGFPAVRRGG
jgi:hypothetical protein